MRRFVISEMSMSPALRPGDMFVARRMRRPRRGAVVFFPHPSRGDFWLAKRLIGLPGETVSVAKGAVYADGALIDDPWTTDPTRPDGDWEVPPGHMFVLSDARARTVSDSRTLGAVPLRTAYAAWFRYRRAAQT